MSDINKKCAECIRAERARRKWSRFDLAEAVGVSESLIGLYERGETSMKLETAINIAGAFGKTLDEMFEFDGKEGDN